MSPFDFTIFVPFLAQAFHYLPILAVGVLALVLGATQRDRSPWFLIGGGAVFLFGLTVATIVFQAVSFRLAADTGTDGIDAAIRRNTLVNVAASLGGLVAWGLIAAGLIRLAGIVRNLTARG